MWFVSLFLCWHATYPSRLLRAHGAFSKRKINVLSACQLGFKTICMVRSFNFLTIAKKYPPPPSEWNTKKDCKWDFSKTRTHFGRACQILQRNNLKVGNGLSNHNLHFSLYSHLSRVRDVFRKKKWYRPHDNVFVKPDMMSFLSIWLVSFLSIWLDDNIIINI